MLQKVQRTDAADHVPVLEEEVRELLDVRPGETIVDATFGAGGHSRLLVAGLEGSGKLIAVDRDPTVRPYFDRVKASARGVQTRFLRGDYAVVLSQLAANGVRADAVLLDLGLSSMQVDRPERGFSYETDAPLDMRMDPSDEHSAADVLATYDERELATLFRTYGEERYARQIARGIVRRRTDEPIERTGQLVDVVKASIPAPARFGEGHPAKRVFQALRIEVNHELESLEIGLPAAFEMLRPGGRLAVISFHSLEDRIVKRFFRDRARGCTCPPELTVCVCGKEPDARVLTSKPLRPSRTEIDHNPRASSARLRVAVRV
jgi:16S rRNA (cytosine1402-N4)-methyltransferase